MSNAPLFMLVAGEVSGDALGQGLIEQIKILQPTAQFIGVGGDRMQSAGLTSLVPMERLSVMGLWEVIKHLPELMRLKRTLIQFARDNSPVVFIGIDSPDFNLRLAYALRQMGIKTVQYVSPSIWVWRRSRVHFIKKAVDQVLCLLPFEPAIYQQYEVDAQYVGHFLADEIAINSSRWLARAELNIDDSAVVLAILPGSRYSEVSRLLNCFLSVAEELKDKYPDLVFVLPMANQYLAAYIKAQVAKSELKHHIHLVQGRARTVMQAADAVLLASGTASLEAALLQKPQVVCYRFNALTAWLAPKLVSVRFFALPNILLDKAWVPECFQQQVTQKSLLPLVEQALFNRTLKKQAVENGIILRRLLQHDAHRKAATKVIELIS